MNPQLGLSLEPEPDRIRGLSLTQPWAWCVRQGLKRRETRSWGTKYRGLVAIHAAQRLPSGADRDAAEALLRGLRTDHGAQIGDLDMLPRGCFVALLNLTACQPTYSLAREGEVGWNLSDELSPLEFDLGNYSPGRWAFTLEDIRPLNPPIQAKGSLGLWRLSATDDVRVQLHATPVPRAL